MPYNFRLRREKRPSRSPKIGFQQGNAIEFSAQKRAGRVATIEMYGRHCNCTGCGDDGHQVCPIEAEAPKPEVVFAVCVFADGTLIDHKGANSMSDCLKTKREVEKAWRNKSEEMDSVEINGITYKIDGESLAFMCDLVDANVHHYEDGTWEIVKILGKHKKDE